MKKNILFILIFLFTGLKLVAQNSYVNDFTVHIWPLDTSNPNTLTVQLTNVDASISMAGCSGNPSTEIQAKYDLYYDDVFVKTIYQTQGYNEAWGGDKWVQTPNSPYMISNNSVANIVDPAICQGLNYNAKITIKATLTVRSVYVINFIQYACNNASKTIEYVINKPAFDITNENAIVCFGDNAVFQTAALGNETVTFYKDAALSFPYSGNNVSNNTLTLKPADYSLGQNSFWCKVTNATGCSKVKKVNFTVNERPTNLQITGNQQNYCVNAPILITPSAVGNVSVYEWSTTQNFAPGDILSSSQVDSQGRLSYIPSSTGQQSLYVRAKAPNGCFTQPLNVTYNIYPEITNFQILNNGKTFCDTETVSFTAGATNGQQYQWYKDANASISLGTATTLNLYNTDWSYGPNTIYVRARGDMGYCTTPLVPVTFNVVATPKNLQVAGASTSYCTGNPVLITPSAIGTNLTYEWSTNSNFVNLLDPSLVDTQGRLNYTPTTPGTYQYYVRAKGDNSCTSTFVSVNFTVNQNVANLQVSNNGATFCKGSVISFVAGANNATNYNWYKFANGTGLLTNGGTYTADPADYVVGANTVYVQASNGNGCSSQMTAVTFNVNESPENLQVSGNLNNYCTGNQVLISPSAVGSSLTYEWSLNSNFVNILGSSFVDSQGRLSYTISNTGTYNYYVRAKGPNGCTTAPLQITFTVSQGVTNLQVSNDGAVFCKGSTVSFTAGATNASEYKWYKFANGTGLLYTGPTYTLTSTEYVIGQNTLYVQASNSTGCNTALIPVSFVVNEAPTNLQVVGNGGAYCIGNPVFITPSANGNNISYQWSTTSNFVNILGSSFVDSNGNLAYTPSTAGNFTYYVRAKSQGNCYTAPEAVTFTVSNAVSNVTVTNQNAQVCAGSPITFQASATNATSYTWSSDSAGVNVIANTPSITLDQTQYVLGTNVIYVKVGNAGGCNASPIPVSFSVNESPTNLEVSGAQASYCTGSQVMITPSATGANLIYEWSSNSNFTTLLGSSFVDTNGNLSFTPANTGNFTYFVRAKNPAGCITASKTVTFTVSTGVSNLQVSNNGTAFCQGSTISFTAGASGASEYKWFKFANGTGLLNNGATYSPGITDYAIGQNTIYIQASSASGCNTALMPVTFTVNEVPSNLQVSGNSATYCIGNPILISASANGNNILYQWSTTSNFVNILGSSFVDANGNLAYTPSAAGNFTYYVRAKSQGNCYTTPETVTFTVSNAVSNVTVTNQNAQVCAGSQITFQASATNATSYTWSSDSAGVNVIANTPSITLDQTQYVLGTNVIYVKVANAGGCNASPIPVSFSVNESPTNLEVSGAQATYCTGSQVMITPSATGANLIYEWSSNSNFTTLLGSSFIDTNGNLNFATITNGSFTYYVRAKNTTGCVTSTKTVTFSVNQGVSNLQVSNNGATFCQGSTISFTAGATGASEYKWFKFANGTGLLNNGATFSPAISDYTIGQNTIYLQASSGSGCNTALMPVTFTINESPANLELTGALPTYCTGTEILISPSATGNGLIYEWSTNSNFTNILNTAYVDIQGNLKFIATTVGNYQFYVRAKNNTSCVTPTKSVSFTVAQGVSNLQVSNNGTSFCQGTAVSFTAGATNATEYKWYKFSNGTGLIFNGATYTPTQNDYTTGLNTVYLQASNTSGCNTALMPVTFTVYEVPSGLQVSGNTQTYCIGNPVFITPSANGNNISYQWSTTSNFVNILGSSFVDANGNLAYTPSAAGNFTYYVRAKSQGNCYTAPEAVTFTVSNAVSNVTVTNQNAQVCAGSPITFQASATNATSYTWSSDSAGVNVIASTPSITLDQTQYVQGTNVIYVKVGNAGGCNASPIPVSFSVNESPTNLEVSGAQASYCTGSQIMITPSAIGTNLSYEWSSNSNFTSLLGSNFVDSNGNLSFTPTATGNFTYFVRAKNPAGCITASKTVTFLITQGVSNLQVSNNGATFCQGSTISFTAGATNATEYKWYKFSNGTGLMFNGTIYNPTPNDYSIGVNTIYLQASNGTGCNTALIPVAFTVNEVPSNLQVSANSATYCIGNPVFISPSANGNNISYQWSTTSNFVNILGSSFVDANGNLAYTPSAAGNFTYYVRAKSQGNCYTTPETVTFTVSNAVSNVTVTNQNAQVCAGSPITFQASATNATSYTWSSDSAGVNVIANTPSITLDQTQYVLGTNVIYVKVGNAGGCNASPIPVSFSVNETPANLEISGAQPSYCTGSQILITPSAIGNNISYEWSLNSNFTTLLGSNYVDSSGNFSYTPSTTGNFTYFVRAKNGSGCVTSTKTVTFNVTQGVSNLQVSNNGATFCKGTTISFTAGATNASEYKWYKFANGTGLLFSGNTYTPAASEYSLGLNTVYLQASSGSNCNTALMPVTFTVNETPTNIAYFGNTTYCTGQQILVTPSALGANVTYQWSVTANFAPSSLLSSTMVDTNGNLTFSAQNVGTNTYYLRAINTQGCHTDGIPVTITINVQPTNLAVNKITNTANTTYCQNGGTEQYLATGVNVTKFKWFADVNLTQELQPNFLSGTNNSILNVDPAIWSIGTHNVYVIGENANGCQTTPKSINFVIISGISNVSPDVNDFTLCQGKSKIVNLLNPNNFTVTWFTNSAGTQLLNQAYLSNNGNTLSIDGNLFTIGTNTLYYKIQNAGGCSSSLTPVTFTILAAPTNLAVTNNNAVVCKGNIVTFEASAFNVSNYAWYKDYATGLVADPQFISGTNNYKLSIPTSNLPAGVYNYTVVGENSNGCKTQPIVITFTVKDVPGNSSLTGLTTYCQTETVHFTLVNSNSNNFSWFTDANGLNPLNSSYISNNGAEINIPGNTFQSGSHSLYYYATNQSCNSPMQTVSFSIKQSPSNLNVSGNNGTYCFGDLIDIVVGSTGGATDYQWFEDAAASLLLSSNYITGTIHERLQTSSFGVGSHTVYVRAINSNGCTSTLLPVSFTVNAKPIISTFATNSSTVTESSPITFNINGSGYTKWKLLFNGSQVAPAGGGWNNGTISTHTYTSSATQANQGTYTLVISNGTCEQTKDFNLYVIPNIVITHDRTNDIGLDNGVSKVVMKQHEVITFSTNLPVNALYNEEWDYGDGFNNQTVAGQHYYNNAGEFSVKLKVTNSVNGDVINLTYQLPILVKEVDSTIPTNTLNPPADYTIYPNPYKEFLGLKFTANQGDKLVLRIYSLSGISVFDTDWTADGVTFDKKWYNPLINKPAGAYLVVIKNVTQNTTFSTKLLKQQ
ncbi:hypothetical protein [Chryseobacterium oncorhynchi]|nr:hypothetical protein [Chryseobacterium oncorhynchi]